MIKNFRIRPLYMNFVTPENFIYKSIMLLPRALSSRKLLEKNLSLVRTKAYGTNKSKCLLT